MAIAVQQFARPSLWGAAAVVLPELGKVFRFPIGEAPAVPKREIKDEFANLGRPIQSDQDALKILIPVLINELEDKNPEDVMRGRAPPEERQEIARWLMAVAAFSGERFWVVVGGNSKLYTFQPVRPNSVAGGIKLLDEIIAEHDRGAIPYHRLH